MWERKVGLKLPENLCQLITEVIRTEQIRTEEVVCEERIFSLDITPIVEAGYVNFYGNDVTERGQFESLLEERNQFITTVFESLSYPFYVINTDDFTIQLANSAACADELPKAITCYNLLHNKDISCAQTGFLCPLQEVKETKRKVIVEHDHIDKHGNIKTYEVHAYPIFDQQGDVSQMIEYSLDITERKRLQEDLRIRSHALGERVKELNCLYGISALVEKAGISVEEILQGTVEIISPAWQYPEITGARIELRGKEFKTNNFNIDSSWQQSAEIYMHDQRIGTVQVCYIEERDDSDEGPFLNEERSLINAIAGRLGKIVERLEVGEALQVAHDELELRVKMRTAELEVTNQMLQREIGERKRSYEAGQNARQIAETLTAASQALTQTLEMDTVLNTLLDYLERLVPFDSANIALLGDEACLAVRAVRGYESGMEAEEILSQNYNIEENPQIQEIFTSGKSVQISDLRQHPGWKTYLELENAGSWMGLPLIAEGKVIGLCGIDKGEPGYFSDEHLNLAETLVSLATVAIQNAWLFEQVRAGRERLQSLSRRLVEVQESERIYIARELHDEAGQALASLKVGLHLLERDANHPEAVITGIAELKLMADEILDNLHRLAMDLRPASLDHLGLVAALRQYVEAVSDKHGLTVQFEAIGFDERLPLDVETALYRIVQEAMTNVVRHAQATRADVILERLQDKIILIVEDNGIGINLSSFEIGDRLGIVGMRERTEMLRGKFEVERTAGTGTTVLVEVPYGN
ncbi:MAG: GAF domain-containing protein, partial [Anaerolineales bacterium]|nr:GAF domain-containing protein [Anaerolineales bacterium]